MNHYGPLRYLTPSIHVITKSNFRPKLIRWILCHIGTLSVLLFCGCLSFENLNSLWCNVDVTLSKHKTQQSFERYAYLENSHPKGRRSSCSLFGQGPLKEGSYIIISFQHLPWMTSKFHHMWWNDICFSPFIAYTI